MVLAVDIDNSRVDFGLFDENGSLVKSFGIATDDRKTSDEYVSTVNGILTYYGVERREIRGAVILSVVPLLTDVLKDAVRKLAGEIEIALVGKGVKTGFAIKVDNPSELGADLVANAAAAVGILQAEQKPHRPCIIIDMGTATTVFALNAKGEFIGGSIMAGVGMSLEALHGRTAQLPVVSPSSPTRAIGKNSQDSVRSGVILGNAMMIDGFIEKFSAEMKCASEPEIFVTGEYADAVIPYVKATVRYIKELTLLGAYTIYKNNLNA